MFGLKDDKKKGKHVFDLEKLVREKPEYRKEKLEKAEARIQEIKKMLREGVAEKQYEQAGQLLQAYVALQKVLKKI